MTVLTLELEAGTLTCDEWLRVVQGKRKVGTGTWQGRPVVAKLFTDPRRAQRNLERELAGARALSAAGLPAPDIEHSTLVDGLGVLILRRIEPAEQATILQAVTALGTLHRAGLIHTDLHLGNFLSGADGTVYFLDWNGILPGSAGLDNLGALLAQMDPNEDDRLPELLSAYGDDSFNLETVRQALRRQRNKRMRKYLKKIFRDCTEFAVTQNAQRYQVCRREQTDRLAALLDAPDRWVESGTPLKRGRTCTVIGIQIDGLALVVKRYNIKNLRHRVNRAFRETRAAHCWRAAHLLIRSGIRTALPLAVVEHRLGPLRGKAYFVTEELTGTRLDQLLAEQPPDEMLTLAVEGLATLFERLLAARISHGDMKASNLFFDGDQLWLIDLDALRQHRNRTGLRRALRRDKKRLLRNWDDQPDLQQRVAARLALIF